MDTPAKTLEICFLVEAEQGAKVCEKAEAGEFLNQVAHRAGVVISQTCGGVPSCADCKVVVKEGRELGFEAPLGPELRLLGNVYFITHERLSCQAIVKGDATVFVPQPQRLKREKMKTIRKYKLGDENGKKETENDKKEIGKKNRSS